MSTLTLSPEELYDITGFKQEARQIKWLLNPPIGEPWKFTINAFGLPKVDKEYYDSRMKDKAERKSKPRLDRLGAG